MTTFVERYLSGDRAPVWRELRALGDRVREPALRADAEAVARESVGRAKRNVETLIDRLRGQGYRFGDPWNAEGAEEPLALPDDKTPAFVAWLEKRFGPLPLTVRAWIEVV